MKLTLSALVKILIEEFIPDIHHKYLLQNYKASSTYRCYNDIVPPYLCECPRSVILHCLERKSNSRKFNVEDIYIQDQQSGMFTIKGSSGTVYAVDFGRSSGEPSCSCLDWNKWNIPCKHFFAVFRLIPNWNWNCLPFSYRSSPYLSTENALQSLPSTTNVMPSSSTQVGEVYEDGIDVTDENLMVADIPHRMVCMFDLYNYSKMYCSLLMYIATTSCLTKELSAESQNNSKRN